jgi:hypothetical protein
VRLVSPIGGAPGGSGNLSTSLSNVAKLAAHPKFVWVFNANYDGTIFYNDPVLLFTSTTGTIVNLVRSKMKFQTNLSLQQYLAIYQNEDIPAPFVKD